MRVGAVVVAMLVCGCTDELDPRFTCGPSYAGGEDCTRQTTLAENWPYELSIVPSEYQETVFLYVKLLYGGPHGSQYSNGLESDGHSWCPVDASFSATVGGFAASSYTIGGIVHAGPGDWPCAPPGASFHWPVGFDYADANLVLHDDSATREVRVRDFLPGVRH
ncbi:MAG TPA: hypothetical protein VGM39_04150 [Kofleriaceae bacterium]